MAKRRTILRAGLVVAGSLAIVIAGLFVLKGRIEKRLHGDLEDRGSAFIGGDISIGKVRISPFPPSVRLEKVRALMVGNRGSRALGAAPMITATTGWRYLLDGGRRPMRIVVEGPLVQLTLAEGREWFPDGALLAAAFERSQRIAAGWWVEVRSGRLEVKWSGGPRGSLSGIRLETGTESSDRGVQGRLEFTGGELSAEDGVWQELRGETRFVLEAGGLRFDPLAIHGDRFAMVGNIFLVAGARQRVEGAVKIGLDAARLAAYFPETAGVAGRLEGNLVGAWEDGVVTAQGDVRAAALNLWGLQLDGLESDLTIANGIALRRLRAHLLGGQATGSLDTSPTDTGFGLDADLRLDGLDLAALLALGAWAGPELTGTVHYRGRHRIESSGIESLTGSGVLDAVGHYRPAGREALPLEVTARLQTLGETLRITGGVIRAGAVRGAFSGSVRKGEGIRLRLDGAGEDRELLAPIFRVDPRTVPGEAASDDEPTP